MYNFFKKLRKHKDIGIDFDETLVDHKYSGYLQEFIIKEHTRRNFWIVTHRSHGLVNTLAEDLEHGSFGTVRLDMFVGVESLPDRIYEKFAQKDIMRKRGFISGDFTPEEIEYFMWKGNTAKRLGITALVDDKPELNENGCLFNGVAFMNINEMDS